ncbi:hypothetical protein V6Z12_D10G162900 [Gossypium hirsutum]|nr:hypothetical protein ES288_D10G172400v1 [Gossypium darwinii]TYH49999.1 hypothetical protein ES332_D10G174900v1 [Gossypium tomentosum]
MGLFVSKDNFTAFSLLFPNGCFLASFFWRFDELETTLMEMVKQDNRRQLCARILMLFEQDQKETEDACRFAEQNAAAQRYSVEVLQV